MKFSPFIFTILLGTLLLTACSTPTPAPTAVELPALPTPDVPPIEEVDQAIETWENNNPTDYFIEVDEENSAGQFKVRLVVADGDIRTAQRLDRDADGNWGEPYSLPNEEASNYTVDALLQRIRRDTLGEGETLFNLTTSFHETLGFPLYAHAEALPSYTETGTLELNRQFSYDFITSVKNLMEDSFGVEADPVFTLIRSSGPEAWCDNLRIYPDGASIYLDDCRNEFWQIPTPESRISLLDSLRANFKLLDDTRSLDGQSQRLIIPGTSQGAPDEDTLDEAWALAAELHELLSQPTGLGLLMSYVLNGDYFGFDVFNQISMPSQLPKTGDVNGAILTQDGMLLAYSDDSGIQVLAMQTQSSTNLLPAPEDGYYIPRAWSSAGRLLVSHYSDNEDNPIRHGWLSLEEPAWHDLPTPEGIRGYGCDTGMAWSPDGDFLAVAGIGYGEPCNSSPGLTVIDFTNNTAQVIVASPINTPEGDDSTLTAGAHTPAWSQDGNWIVFSLDQDPNESADFPSRLYRTHVDGSNLTPLTNNSNGFATHPVWTQDGSLYYGLNNADADLDGLYRYLPTENIHTLLMPGNSVHPLSISPDGNFLLYEQQQALKIWRTFLQETIAEISGEPEVPPSFAGWIEVESEE